MKNITAFAEGKVIDIKPKHFEITLETKRGKVYIDNTVGNSLKIKIGDKIKIETEVFTIIDGEFLYILEKEQTRLSVNDHLVKLENL